MADTELETRLARQMALAQRGDKRAYEALLRACIPIAAAMARYQGLAPEQIDDAVQEILITIDKARATYDPARAFLPWLRAIARHRSLDALRHHGRLRARQINDSALYLDQPDPAPSADQYLEEGDLRLQLVRFVGALPAGQRQAVESLYLAENTLGEASAESGRSKGALKVNLHRGLKTLRQRLRSLGAHEGDSDV